MKKFLPLSIGLALILTGCFSSTATPGTDTQGSSSLSSEPVQETKNVLYRGTLESSSMSIFMEGTHRLRLEDGRFILLESTTVDLDTYLDQRVEVFGAIRPTVEAGGMIMRVERVTSLEPVRPSSSSSQESSVSSAIFISSSVVASSQPAASSVPAVSSAPRSSIASSSKAAVSSSSTPPPPPPPPASSSMAWQASEDLSAKAAIMAKDNLADANWSRQYCTSHIGFCIPIHRNWWFNSFGTTSSTLWHVEIGPSEIVNLGEGPLSINLISGSVEASGNADGAVVVQGDSVTGYRSWKDNRHFEIVGPANLEAAIRYLTAHLLPFGS